MALNDVWRFLVYGWENQCAFPTCGKVIGIIQAGCGHRFHCEEPFCQKAFCREHIVECHHFPDETPRFYCWTHPCLPCQMRPTTMPKITPEIGENLLTAELSASDLSDDLVWIVDDKKKKEWYIQDDLVEEIPEKKEWYFISTPLDEYSLFWSILVHLMTQEPEKYSFPTDIPIYDEGMRWLLDFYQSQMKWNLKEIEEDEPTDASVWLEKFPLKNYNFRVVHLNHLEKDEMISENTSLIIYNGKNYLPCFPVSQKEKNSKILDAYLFWQDMISV